MFRWLRWHLAKMRLAFMSVSHPPRHIKVRYRRHRAKAEHLPPNADPYGPLAVPYNEYARWFVPLYGRFLAAVGRYYGLPVRSVLDLACGTGLVSRQVAQRAESVVGLDISEVMLREARSRTPGNKVCYVRGDFRDFCLDETFDAVICGTDALNYLGKPRELAGVLLGILFRVRAFLFLGISFLFLDVFTMIWYAAVDRYQTWVWWVSGIVLGAAILTLFAVFEKRRNDVLLLLEEIKRWD